MKRPILLLLSLILLAGCQPYGEPRESDDPLFFLLKRLDAVERIKNQIYPDARQAILTAGWKPLQDHPEAEGRPTHASAKELLKRGYVEIEDCDGSQPTFCHFVFSDSLGNKLLVTTADGEQRPSPAIVTYTQVLSEYRPSND